MSLDSAICQFGGRFLIISGMEDNVPSPTLPANTSSFEDAFATGLDFVRIIGVQIDVIGRVNAQPYLLNAGDRLTSAALYPPS